MFANEMTTGDFAFVITITEGKRTHTRVGIENVAGSELGARECVIRFVQQVFDFPHLRLDVIEVVFEANVGGANQVKMVPRHYKKWTAIFFSFEIDCHFWCVGKLGQNNVAALCSSNKPGRLPWSFL